MSDYIKGINTMLKDAFYFSHDSNAKDDPKCVLLIEQLGLEGYGIFWVLIETLREQPGYKYPFALLSALARRFNTTFDKMRIVVCNYELFTVIDNEFFFSESLMRRMQQMDYKRDIARLAGKASAQKRLQLVSGSTDVERTLNDSSTSKVNKSKVNESKINKYNAEFEAFYSYYPRPEDKHRTFTNWKTQLKHFTVDQLMSAARNYKTAKAGIQVQFIKSSANFLGKEKIFEDYLTGGDSNNGNGGVESNTGSDKKKFDIDKSKFLAPGT
jgi:hypothetical protein